MKCRCRLLLQNQYHSAHPVALCLSLSLPDTPPKSLLSLRVNRDFSHPLFPMASSILVRPVSRFFSSNYLTLVMSKDFFVTGCVLLSRRRATRKPQKKSPMKYGVPQKKEDFQRQEIKSQGGPFYLP